ncbi:unnamed protein product [Parnassius apollo]|uniref:(apollo) hypothetical protein n=1 Tax=Parnassius apollo TaxID=110799 RepID=A0A8S3X077_PARAO|nr:unnamed protein product [Parnassius apollo]
MVVYTENNSSEMKEPYSPVVSEYLPSHHTSRSSSLVRELCSPLPSSLIHDMINSPQNDSESTFKFETPLKMHSIVDFIASPLIIYTNMSIIDNSKELADDSDIISQVNYYNRIEGVKPLLPSIDISSTSIKENSLNLKNLPQNAEIPLSSSVINTDSIVTDIICNITDTNNFDTAEATKSQSLRK